MVASKLRCSPCPAVALLALFLLIGWSEQAAVQHLRRALSPPLVDEDTYVAVDKVAKQVSFFNGDLSKHNLKNPSSSGGVPHRSVLRPLLFTS